MLTFKNDYIRIAAVYTFMISGGVWSMLGKYSDRIKYSTTFIMIGLSLAIIFELLLKNGFKKPMKLLCFTIFVMVLALAVDIIGFSSGFLYNVNYYSFVFKPIFWGVPLIVSVAWIIGFLLFYNLIEYVEEKFQKHFRLPYKIILISILTNIFGIIHELAAYRMGYWTWSGGILFFLNYSVWWIEGIIIGTVFYKTKLNNNRPTFILNHYLIALLVYFGLCMV